VASHYIATYVLITDRGGDYGPGTYVNVNWNDVSEAIEVYTAEDFFSGFSLQTSGPSFGSASIDYTVTNYNYKFCEALTLNYFTLTPYAFPYVRQEYIENSFACAVDPTPTCDLQFDDNPTITGASNAASNDGSVTVNATSSNGTIKYALFNFEYGTQGQTSNVFSGLYGATYTIYAKDSAGCQDTITVIVPVSETYTFKYFMEFTDIHGKENNGFNHKIEIYERGYVGSASELQAKGDPFSKKLNADAEDKFFIIRASELNFTFLSQTSFQYHDLFTEDDRQFLVKHYIDYGSGYELDWTGYLIPFFYSENHVNHVYEVSVTATDGLASLKELDFVDESGENLKGTVKGIEIISIILKKLGLSLNIRSAINMYDSEFDSADTDDPLQQVYYDTSVYYDEDGVPEKCDKVLKYILTDYLAVIAQSDNTWIIWRPEELISDFDYRENDPTGSYVSNGNIDPANPIDSPTQDNRLAWKDRSGVLTMLPSYGKFTINQKLIRNKSLFPSYGFEAEDVRPYIGETFFFYGWGLIIDQGSGMTWGLRVVDRESSKGALYIQWVPFYQDVVVARKAVTIYNTQGLCEYSYKDNIRFSFDYLIESIFQFPFLKIEFKLMVGDFFYDPFNANTPWTTDDNGYVSIYTTKVNAWETFEFNVISPSSAGGFGGGQVQVFIKINNAGGFDYASEAAVRAIDTIDLNIGYKITMELVSGIRFFYELTYSNESDDVPNIIRPNDYDDPGNLKVWSKIGGGGPSVGIGRHLIDNVIFEVLPDGFQTPENQEYTIIINPNNKRTLEIETFHGDCPQNIVNAQYAYKNYIKRLDGFTFLPTSAWTRSGYNESDVIQKIMLSTLVGQFSKAGRRLTGNIMGDIYLKPYSVLNDQFDSNRPYLVQGFEELGRLNEYNVDLYEIKESEEANPDGAAFSDEAFGIAFDI
jgi:hypothetical protein